jgi:hypothetical protein
MVYFVTKEINLLYTNFSDIVGKTDKTDIGL